MGVGVGSGDILYMESAINMYVHCCFPKWYVQLLYVHCVCASPLPNLVLCDRMLFVLWRRCFCPI